MNIRACCIVSNVILCAIGITLIVLASLVVHYVNTQINNGVTKSLTINRNYGSWSSDTINDWIQTTSNYSYYAWNITNLQNVMAGIEKPRLQQVGPYNVVEFDYKYNISWSADNTIVYYNEWWEKVWKTDADARATTDLIYSLNPAYVGAVSLLSNFSYGLSNQETGILSSFQSQVIAGFDAKFLNPQGSLLSLVRILSIPIYIKAVATMGKTPTAWSNTTTLSTGALTCFEIVSPANNTGVPDYTKAISATTAASLWNSNVNGSLTASGMYGIMMWAQLANDYATSPSTFTTLPSFQYLSATWGVSTTLSVLNWIGLITNTQSYCANSYQSVVVPLYTINCNATTWADLGACQFGASSITQQLQLGLSINAFDPTSASSCAGLMNFGIYCMGPELYAYTNNTNNCAAPFTLSISEAKSFLSTFSSSGSGTLPTCGTQSFSGTTGLSFMLAGYQQTAASGNTTLINQAAANIAAVYGSAGFTTARLSNGQAICMYNYMTQVANIYGFIGGIVAANGGLFTYRTPAEIMFGYPADNPDPLLAGLGESYTGVLTNYTSQEEHYATTQQRPYAYYTGVGNINLVRQYNQYEGYNKVQSLTDVYETADCLCGSAITDWDGCTGNCLHVYCPNIWAVPDYVDQSSDGLYFAPFQEGIAPTSWYRIYSTEGMRVLNFTYLQDSSVKNINTRRFVIRTQHLWNESDYPDNARYYQVGPRGCVQVADWNQYAPIYVSRPMYAIDADPWVAAAFTPDSFNIPSDPSALLTYIDVEPLSGATMQGHKRLQYTLKISNQQFNNPYYSNIFNQAQNDITAPGKAYYWPAFWVDQQGIISDSDASDFRSAIYSNRDLAERLEIAGYVVGAFFVVLSIAGLIYYIRKKEGQTAKPMQILSENDVTSPSAPPGETQQ